MFSLIFISLNSIVISAGFRKREALGYSTDVAPHTSPPSRLGEDGSVFDQFQ